MFSFCRRASRLTRSLLLPVKYRLREEMSVLFEQVRSFGGSLVIAAQGYAGLGPADSANRILDAANTYVLHACSDPAAVSRRAGKRMRLATSYSEDVGSTPRRHLQPKLDWKVPEHAVMQQETGLAYWINRGRAQQALTVPVPLTPEQVQSAWGEVQEQQEAQRLLREQRAARRQQQQAGKPSLDQPP